LTWRYEKQCQVRELTLIEEIARYVIAEVIKGAGFMYFSEVDFGGQRIHLRSK
jgi:hypothetical protein